MNGKPSQVFVIRLAAKAVDESYDPCDRIDTRDAAPTMGERPNALRNARNKRKGIAHATSAT